MVALQGIYEKGTVRLLNPAPVDQANVLVVFPDEAADRENAMSDDEARRLFNKFTNSIDRAIDEKQERLEALEERDRGSDIHVIAKEVVDSVLDLLHEEVYKIVLYGSYARGDFTIESDIDIIILLNCQKEEISVYRTLINELSSRISLKNDVEVSLMLKDRATFEHGLKIQPFYQNVAEEGVVLYG